MRILIAEDAPLQRLLLQSLLTEWGHDVIVTKNGTEALAALQTENPIRLAILDWMMPGASGIDICKQIRATSAGHYVYILLLTARNQEQDLVEAFEAGADDYLTKPVIAAELKGRLRAGTRVLELEERLIATSDSLRIQATHDSLTGLFNRGAIVDVLQRELARAVRANNCVGVILADVDYFKQINDTEGHETGDAVLMEISRKMQSSVRVYDSVGRYGGEEFLIILPGCNPEDTRQKAEQIRRSINYDSQEQYGRPVSVSIGAASISQTMDYQQVLRSVDVALYRAKAQGRNRVELSDCIV
jgi:two-component system, cell cycle response regulator